MVKTREEIRDYIYSEAVEPGTCLTEREIAERFQLKRSNAREMLLALEGEGSIRRIPQKGYCSVDYGSTDTQTVLALRYAIEREALREGVQRATREDMVRITLIFEDMERYLASGDMQKYAQADIEFHSALIVASHDNLLINFFNFMKATIFPRINLIQSKSEDAQTSHRQIYEAFKRRDAQGVHDTLKKHIGKCLEN